MPTIGTSSKPAYVYDAGTDTWIPIGPGEHTHAYSDITHDHNATYIAKTLTTTTGDLIYASSANTPARLGIGSTDQVLKVSGGIPAWAAGFGTLTAYTPTWTNITIGNGTFTDVNYSVSGDLVWYYGMFTFGSTTTTSGGIELSLPINADSTASNVACRSPVWNLATVCDTSTGYSYKLMVGATNNNTADKMSFYSLLTNSTYLYNDAQVFQQTVPITLAANDTIWWNVFYKKA